jgi:hypothetical protein
VEVNICIPLSDAHKKSIQSLERTLCPIVKEGKGVDERALATFTPPGVSRYRKCAESEMNTVFLFQTSNFYRP